MSKCKKLIKKCEDIQDWIVESEMGGELDKSDPYYPAYKGLERVIEKLEEGIC